MIPSTRSLRLSGDLPQYEPSQRRQTLLPRGEKFIRGPVPMRWLEAAGRLPGRALHVGCVVWFLSGVEGRMVNLRLGAKLLRGFGVSRYAAYRALAALQGAGLVTVQRGKGRSPVVSLLISGIPDA